MEQLVVEGDSLEILRLETRIHPDLTQVIQGLPVGTALAQAFLLGHTVSVTTKLKGLGNFEFLHSYPR